QQVDPARSVQRALFDRVYDHTVERLFRARRSGRWWVLDVAKNHDRVVLPVARTEPKPTGRVICVCHDVERGWGHRQSHPEFADMAERVARAALPAMLEVEAQLAVRATYHVVGAFVADVRDDIRRHGHTLAFHSFDHDLRAPQLERCRAVDYRLRGYRAPQSRRTRELNDRNLCRHNFEWFATSAAALGAGVPTLQNRVVHVPIAFDDYPLFTGEQTYEVWEARALEHIEQRAFTAFCLHDCYADYWLPHYRKFLGKLARLGRLATLDQVSRDLLLAAAA
ncbi:MAG TPA: hypothetical protein VK864_09730, partial [Longimicrobiales bacterium]|nr:hypothetical protein [Longimicrobiales bacterium]